MKDLLLIFAFIAVASALYLNTSGNCAFSGTTATAQAAAGDSATTVSMDAQPNVPAGWVTDYQGALAKAKKEGKAVLIDFTGSDWCGWCIKLDKEVFDQAAFEEYAEKNLVRVYLDFPNNKPQTEALSKQNEELAKKYGVQGFPTIMVLDSDGQSLAKIGYQRGGAEKYVETLKGIIDGTEKS
ncbi:thioredoxin family protein [Cerasicoccus maritimus]|uniref:thioredoxin family protein n=1 Tax=Cerasicoccus maritimus TaxID=490089 RepID=UPI0028529D0F|nr:thioredoxin family protein [Cerasicoccus maritimus]